MAGRALNEKYNMKSVGGASGARKANTNSHPEIQTTEPSVTQVPPHSNQNKVAQNQNLQKSASHPQLSRPNEP